MKKRTLGKSIWIITYSILLCVTVSVAWILNMKPNVVENIIIDYDTNGQLIIAPMEISGKVYVTNEYGKEVELDEDFSVTPNEVVPNSVIPFKIRLRNNTASALKVDVSLVGIEVNNEKILSVVYFSATPSAGWTAEMPKSVYKQLGEATKGTLTDTYSIKAIENVTLRSTDTQNQLDYMEFSCYLYFDGETMTNEYQNVNLTIGAFRITQR